MSPRLEVILSGKLTTGDSGECAYRVCFCLAYVTKPEHIITWGSELQYHLTVTKTSTFREQNATIQAQVIISLDIS